MDKVDKISLLEDVPLENVFRFNNGVSVRNIYELVKELNSINQDLFLYHKNSQRDDFAQWISAVLKDVFLAKMLININSKERYVKIIQNRISFVEKKNKYHHLWNIFKEKYEQSAKSTTMIIIRGFRTLFLLILVLGIYLLYQSLQNINVLNERISYIENKNTCFNDYFNEQLLDTKSYINNVTFNYGTECVLNYSTTSKIKESVLENIPQTVPSSAILVDSNKATISIDESFISIFTNSSSMLPIINHNAKALQIKPKTASVLNVGDIISFNSGNDIIVHRIVEIGSDNSGFYAITKGDNNMALDPFKVRFDDIIGKVVVVIY